ncbi:PspA/IM30 family protein [Suttonella ornithocola]|uniref:Phage shock protein A homolog n=1 Tax=Suttonella ornithocola TaxID=279832 RepID=A0A380MVX5_9GAMM|nr:PspA/IM30 family protein [Suttonella ornithocola]SUO96334.1 Phage shock protein A homolog [Suttonella ornithocola]
MNIWEKLLTALRGGVNEAGEKLVDSQALRILEQELRDASSAFDRAKQSLVEVMAQQKVAEQALSATEQQIQEYEGYALQALEKENEALAHEVAGKIAYLEEKRANEQQQANHYQQCAEQLRQDIRDTDLRLQQMRQQLDTVKATESVQQAQRLIAERFGQSQNKLHSAMESLARIQAKQQHQAAKHQAQAELSQNESASLEAKLKAAGIKPSNSADAVLARLKAKKEN